MATGIKENYFDYALFYNNITCLSDINCSGISLFNINSTSSTILNNLNNLSNVSTLSINNEESPFHGIKLASFSNFRATSSSLNNLQLYPNNNKSSHSICCLFCFCLISLLSLA